MHCDTRACACACARVCTALWQVMHPSLGEPIPPYLRMSSFIFANVPIIAGMLATTSVPGQLFWQFANQTYNSALNYANRAGASVSTEELATG